MRGAIGGATRAPHVAVCVPVHGDPGGLRALLAALREVDYPGDRLHVVVAVDGPDDELATIARDAGARVVVLPENKGSYAARNAAVAACPDAAQVVLFTDADCRPGPRWVQAHLAALTGAELSGGAVVFDAGGRPSPAAWVDLSSMIRQRHFVERVGFAATCNLGVRREVLARLRFDDTLRSGGDYDFCARARAAGFRLVYAEDAVVAHRARGTLRALLRKQRRVARGVRTQVARGTEIGGWRPVGQLRPLAAARRAGVSRDPWWLARVWLVDALCRAVYAAYVPQVVLARLPRAVRLEPRG